MIALTGGTGFIGSVLIQALNDAGHKDVLVVDTLGTAGKFKNVRAKSFTDIVHPIKFLEDLQAGKVKPEAILHIGAITDTSEPDADSLYRDNTWYTRQLAQWAIDHDVRFIYASSASVYGDGALGFSDADDITPKLLPLNPYAFSKWMFDTEAIRSGWTDKIVGLRFFNVYGPNEYHKARMASVIWHATNQVRDAGEIVLFQSHKEGYKDGEQQRDFVYVKDLCAVVLWFLEHPKANGIYNLGTGRARTFNDLAAAIFAALGKAPNIRYVPTPENIRNAYQYHTEADLVRLRAAGCDVSFAPMEDSVKDYVQGYLLKEQPYL